MTKANNTIGLQRYIHHKVLKVKPVLGFQLSRGRLVGPQDFFADAAFDEARRTANEIANYLRRLGPFEPHRLPLDEMEYTTLPDVMKRLSKRFAPLEEKARPKEMAAR